MLSSAKEVLFRLHTAGLLILAMSLGKVLSPNGQPHHVRFGGFPAESRG